ncbi:MAG: AAA family ATPase, partial [Treponema sp.]|nr:AAA family ATPase [Treponema sp.]
MEEKRRMVKMGWIPSEEEYNPEITKEQWIEFIQDKNIFNENALITFACIQKAKIATCADMAEEFGRSANFYNTNNWRTGERIFKKINCPLSEREEGGNRFWSVCCLGRSSVQGRWEFKIRPELQEAFEETGMLEGIEVMEKKEKISCIMANIAWNENDWKSPSDNKTNFRWTQVEGNIPNESWNFDFDNPRNSEKEILGFIQFTHPPKNAERDKFLIIFRSDNKIVGFYGNAEIKKEAVKKSEYEYSNIVGDKELVVLLDNKIDDSDYKFLFGKERVGMIGFNYLNPIDAQTILDEAIKTNPNQIDTLMKIKEWLNQGDTQMTQENSLVKKYASLLKNTKNLILTGAPGTGKTYLAKTIAARLILDREINDFDKDLSEEEKKQVESQTGFVQFHPSYDYTDFVEGLRPTDKDGNGNVGFERRDGVFKEFCAKALENLVETPLNNDESQNFDEAWEKLLDEVRENIAAGKLTKIGIWEYGLSSTNSLKYESTDTQSKYTFTITKKNVFDAYRGIKARPSGYFQKYMKEVADYMKKYGLKEYKEKSGPEKEKKSFKNFVFIIDEINRGEVAKIFGELFYCVDPGYRGEKGWIKTQYANLETVGNEFDKVLQKKEKDFGHFFIPENVYIIGTMNDIDRSVESMDFAFRRRFTWAEVKASDTVDMLYPSTTENGEP